MGYPHHLQTPMHGGTGLDPKYPPATEDYHHHNHLHHNGYGHAGDTMSPNMASMQSPNDYMNGMSHHHHHHHQNLTNGIQPTQTNGYNYSHHTISGHFYQQSYNAQMHHAPTPPTQPTATTNTPYANTNNNGYYNNYYGSSTDNNQPMDAPLQYPSNAEPTNTLLGFHELGVFCVRFSLYCMIFGMFCREMTGSGRNCQENAIKCL